MNRINIRTITFIFTFFLGLHVLQAQVDPEDPVYAEILHADSLLFEAGFNNCDYEALYQTTDSTFTFYHDQSGITKGQENFVEGIKNNICSIDYRPKRKLLKERTKIYPLKSNGKLYGVIQKGVHQFYAIEKGKEPYLTSTAKFTHVWIKKEDQWKLQTVLSYDHKSPNEHNN